MLLRKGRRGKKRVGIVGIVSWMGSERVVENLLITVENLVESGWKLLFANMEIFLSNMDNFWKIVSKSWLNTCFIEGKVVYL